MNQVSSLFNSYIQTNLINGKAKALNLQTGQIVRGTVLDLIDSHNALVMINNTKLLARLEVPLEKGQRSWFIVNSEGEEVRLKIMTDKNSPSKAVVSNQELIKNLDIKNIANNRMILNELVNRDLPFSKQIVENISLALDKDMKLNNILDVVKYLSSKNLPINLKNISSVNEFFQNEDVFNKLENINKDIQNLLLKNDRNISEQVKVLESNKVQVNVEKSIVLPEKVTSQLNKINVQIEDLVKEYKSIRNENSSSLNVMQTEKVDSKQIVLNFSKAIDTIQNSFTNNINNNNDSLAKNIEQLLLNKSQLPSDLAMNLEKAVNHLNGQNLALSSEQSLFSQLTIQIPSMVPFSDNPVFIQVHSRKKEEKYVDPDDMLLVFLFNLDNLGDLLVKMKVVNKDLFIQINNNYPGIKEIIKVLEPDFIEFLQEYGYKTSGITVQTIENRKNQKVTSFEPNYKGVDIRL